MRRRDVLAAIIVAVCGPHPLKAQSARRARLGYLSGGSPETRENTVDVLIGALRELGWRIGENLEIDEEWAKGDFSKLHSLAGELVARHPDLIVATGSTETTSLQAATTQIPIVFMQVADPIALGVIESIRHPGRNTTGFAQSPQILWGKRLDLLTELLGHSPRRIAWLGNPENAGSEASWADAKDATTKSGADLLRIDVSTADKLDRAFEALSDRDALLVQWDFLFATVRSRIAELAARQRLPAIYENRLQVSAGGLMSYGADLRENYRQGALYVHRILNGAHPGDLPVVQPTAFELVINLKTAKAIGLTVPPSLLARADEVIE